MIALAHRRAASIALAVLPIVALPASHCPRHAASIPCNRLHHEEEIALGDLEVFLR
jgi:hypothetical protein